jgi:hypothetical protein
MFSDEFQPDTAFGGRCVHSRFSCKKSLWKETMSKPAAGGKQQASASLTKQSGKKVRREGDQHRCPMPPRSRHLAVTALLNSPKLISQFPAYGLLLPALFSFRAATNAFPTNSQ